MRNCHNLDLQSDKTSDRAEPLFTFVISLDQRYKIYSGSNIATDPDVITALTCSVWRHCCTESLQKPVYMINQHSFKDIEINKRQIKISQLDDNICSL